MQFRQTDQSGHTILYSMQLQSQIIHTPTHFLGAPGNLYPLNTDKPDRYAIESDLFATSNILIERNDFQVRIADTQVRQKQVGALINKMYAWRGYRLDAGEPRCRSSQTTLQACRGDDTLGTLTLNIDAEEGLLADGLYCREIDALRMRGGTVCELTGLAVSIRDGSNELLAALFHLLHILGRKLHRATDAVIEVNPRHSLYYQKLLGFRQIGVEKTCSRVDAPAVLLHIETDFIEAQIAHHADNRKQSGRSLYPYFFSSRESESLSQRILEIPHLRPAHS